MPEDGVEFIQHDKIISFEQIVDFVKYSVNRGVRKVRLTGGEPLVRKDILHLVSEISKIDGIEDFAMTTNGVLLGKFAKELARNGLHRVNISLDTLDENEFSKITRGGDLNLVLKGIDAAIEAGLTPVKINCVIKKSKKEKNAQQVAEFCKSKGIAVRFIKQMDLKAGSFDVVDGGEGGNCKTCNRLRVSSTSKLIPCLFSDLNYDINELGKEKALDLALKNKPEKGELSLIKDFYNIGG
jgi:cyclic pyranopterin phosphate synthase